MLGGVFFVTHAPANTFAQELGGVRLFVGLLGRPEEDLRLLGLRLLLSFVPLLPAEPPVPQQVWLRAVMLDVIIPRNFETLCIKMNARCSRLRFVSASAVWIRERCLSFLSVTMVMLLSGG